MDPDFNTLSRSPMQGSPSQGRTMKEYEDQLAALRKENFKLKLRVYFLEERSTASNTPANQDDLLKKNIELKVSLESLRRECSEKKDLLCAAARALETVEATAIRKESELNAQIGRLQEQLDVLHETANGYKSHQRAIVGIESLVGGISTEADDSVALYATAFNLRPTTKDVKALREKAHSATAPCECIQLKSLLETERNSCSQLRQSSAAKDQVISQQIKQIKGLIHQSKSPVITNLEPNSATNGELVYRVDSPVLDDDIQNQLERQQQENRKAMQMIQSCLMRIKQMDKENKKIKASLQRKEDRIVQLQKQAKRAGLQFPLESTHSATDFTSGDGDTNVSQQYTDVINQKDNRIAELEEEIKSLTISKVSETADNSSHNEDKDWSWMENHLENKLISIRESLCMMPKGELSKNTIEKTSLIEDKHSKDLEHKNVQEMLASRLTEMACFLDTLLSHRCVLGEEKRKKVKSLMEQSLELPVGLKLDPEASRVLENTFAADVTFGNMSQSFRIEDLTRLLGHHASFDESCVSRHPINEHLEEDQRVAEEASLQSALLQQRLVIEKLTSRLQDVRSRCICASTAAEDSDEKFISSGLKSLVDTGGLSPRRSKPCNRRAAKSQLNNTWHGMGRAGADRSESECWSEPDRGVSLARMGRLAGEDDGGLTISSEEDDHRPCRMTPVNRLETDALIKRLTEERDRAEELLEIAKARIEDLQLRLESSEAHCNVEVEKYSENVNVLTHQLEEVEKRLICSVEKHKEALNQLNQEKAKAEEGLERAVRALEEEQEKSKMQAEAHLRRTQEMTEAFNRSAKEAKAKLETEWVSKSRYEALRKEADGAALQASQAALDRHLAAEQRMRSDAVAERATKNLDAARLRISHLETQCAELQNRLCWRSDASRSSDSPAGASPSPPRAPSPDQGIDSDRLSSLEMIESGASNDDLASDDMATQNVILSERLVRLQRRYEAAVLQIKEADSRKKMVHKAICQEIHKTRSVLRHARDNFRSDP